MKDMLVPILRQSNAMETVIITDAATLHTRQSDDFADHDFTTHREDAYVTRELPKVHTNTVEGFHSIFKRSM